MAEEVGNQSAQARALNTLGMIQPVPDPVGSRRWVRGCLRICASRWDHWCVVDTSLNLAWSHQEPCDEARRGRAVPRAASCLLPGGAAIVTEVAWYWLQESWRPRCGKAGQFRSPLRALATRPQASSAGQLPDVADVGGNRDPTRVGDTCVRSTAATLGWRPSSVLAFRFSVAISLSRVRRGPGSDDAGRVRGSRSAGTEGSQRVSAGLVHRQLAIEGGQLERAARRSHRTGNRELAPGVVQAAEGV